MHNYIDPTFRRVSFADQLRYEIEDTLGFENRVLWDKPYSDTIRRLLQWWGTELRRDKDENYWVRKAAHVAKLVEKQGNTPVFTDVRFPNEARMIEDYGGFIVRVTAPLETRERRLGTLPPEHASETEVDKLSTLLSLESTDRDGYLSDVRRIVTESHINDLMEGIRASFT